MTFWLNFVVVFIRLKAARENSKICNAFQDDASLIDNECHESFFKDLKTMKLM